MQTATSTSGSCRATRIFSLRDELVLQTRLERILGRTVDLVRLDHANGALRWRIAREGVVVRASPAHEAARFLAAAAIEHDEIADLIDDASLRFAARVRGAPA